MFISQLAAKPWVFLASDIFSNRHDRNIPDSVGTAIAIPRHTVLVFQPAPLMEMAGLFPQFQPLFKRQQKLNATPFGSRLLPMPALLQVDHSMIFRRSDPRHVFGLVLGVV